MDSPLMRSAIGCAVACGAFLTGPLGLAAVANADLLGGGGGGVDVLGIDVLGGGTAKKSAGGAAGRVSTVSTAPSARTVVIRTKTAASQPDSSVVPATARAPMAERPAVAMAAPVVESMPAGPPPAAPPLAAPLPAAGPISVPPPAGPAFYPPAPEAVPISPTNEPRPSRGMGPGDTVSPPQRVPDSFRVGYAEHLRAADTGDLIAAALPGVAGIAGFTLAGAYAGYRQAKALQQALLAPVPTSILM